MLSFAIQGAGWKKRPVGDRCKGRSHVPSKFKMSWVSGIARKRTTFSLERLTLDFLSRELDEERDSWETEATKKAKAVTDLGNQIAAIKAKEQGLEDLIEEVRRSERDAQKMIYGLKEQCKELSGQLETIVEERKRAIENNAKVEVAHKEAIVALKDESQQKMDSEIFRLKGLAADKLKTAEEQVRTLPIEVMCQIQRVEHDTLKRIQCLKACEAN